ncbi:hypothetical protein MAUB1S_11319 [Mycolicibacterium aubagnense]
MTKYSMLGKLGLIVLLLSSAGVRADILVETDVLPFGWPADAANMPTTQSPALNKADLAKCIERQQQLYQDEANLRLQRSELMADQAGEKLAETMKAPVRKEPVDDVDRQLDQIEKDRQARDPGLDQRIVNHIIKRQEYFHDFSSFIKDCGSRPYRLKDLHDLVGKQ